jgi:hypothetical protein
MDKVEQRQIVVGVFEIFRGVNHAGNLTLQTCNIEVPDLTAFSERVKSHPL